MTKQRTQAVENRMRADFLYWKKIRIAEEQWMIERRRLLAVYIAPARRQATGDKHIKEVS